MELSEAIQKLLAADWSKMTLSCPRKRNDEHDYVKARIRRVIVKRQPMVQLEYLTAKQAFQKNLPEAELEQALEAELTERFAELNAAYADGRTALIKVSKKGKVIFKVTGAKAGGSKATGIQASSQNREKKYLMKPGTRIEPLIDLGVMSADGKIINSQYDKYRQINRFQEMVSQAIPEEVTELNVVDFGCGKGYITFLLYFFLTQIRNIKVNMVGLDLKADVIKHCNETARKYGYDGLRFEVGDINGYTPDLERIDMVISLHACDTATDFALDNAIQWGARYIFSVPCCQHELFGLLSKESYGSLTEYGLFKERLAALLTDAIRADLIRSKGYEVSVLEFVDFENSPKNVMLRCVKDSDEKAALASHRKAAEKALERAEETMKTAGVEPTLYKLLYE